VPELTRKMSNVPGQPNHIWLQADKPGTYIGQCSEFCGTQHAWMRILVVADEPSKFEEWQRAQLQPGQARQVILPQKAWPCFKHPPVSTVMLSVE